MNKVQFYKMENFKACGYRIAIVASRFYPSLAHNLVNGCVYGLHTNGVFKKDISIFETPGAFEIAFVVRKLIDSMKFDAIITLGIVIKGQTDHYTHVCNQIARALMEFNMLGKVPVIFEVLMVENESLALKRASPTNMKRNKGFSAALAALRMISLYKGIEL